MGAFIDRDPDKMIKYGEDAKNILSDMSVLITKMSGVLESASPFLDDRSQKEIEKLRTCVSNYYKQMKVYEDVAQICIDKGKKLKRIREEY